MPYMKSKGILPSAYAPLTPVTKARPGPVDSLLEAIAKKYYVSEGEVALRWCIGRCHSLFIEEACAVMGVWRGGFTLAN